jgi:hypothetical protein
MMKSIRPLVTITILTVVGVFLYFKIQEAPEVSSSSNSAWELTPGVPALDGTVSPDPNSVPPAWNPPPPQVNPAVSNSSAALAQPTSEIPADLPAIPEIPELPPLEPPAPQEQAVAPAVTPPAALPRTVPTANYRDSSLPVEPVAAVQPTAGSPLATENGTKSTFPAELVEVAPPAGTAPVHSIGSYAMAKPAIQAKLQQGELAEAHLLLSQFYGDRSLTPDQRKEVQALLSQLAGTVIYSTEHLLEPAYTVRDGDTLVSIAQQYQVPWQLLANVNGVTVPDAVRPGQKLKVMRGPFMGMLNLSTGELTLLLQGRYAGKFTVMVPSMATFGEGEWLVEKKLAMPGSGSNISQTSTVITPPEKPVVDRTLLLKSTATTQPPASLSLGSTSGLTSQAGSSAANIQMTQHDAQELSDILSVGSMVIIRR